MTEIIIAAINAGIMLIDLAMKAGATLKQSGELTPEQEKALDDAIAGLKDKPWWQVQS
jgi:hypothetical protein